MATNSVLQNLRRQQREWFAALGCTLFRSESLGHAAREGVRDLQIVTAAPSILGAPGLPRVLWAWLQVAKGPSDLEGPAAVPWAGLGLLHGRDAAASRCPSTKRVPGAIHCVFATGPRARARVADHEHSPLCRSALQAVCEQCAIVSKSGESCSCVWWFNQATLSSLVGREADCAEQAGATRGRGPHSSAATGTQPSRKRIKAIKLLPQGHATREHCLPELTAEQDVHVAVCAGPQATKGCRLFQAPVQGEESVFDKK